MSKQTSQPELTDGSSMRPEAERLSPAGVVISADDVRLVEALRRGEETAFVELLDRYHSSLIRLALIYVSNRAVAEELVQETWLAVLQGIHRFEGRSSLKTWIFRILMNQAKKRAQREGRQIPFSALWRPETDMDEPAVEPGRFWPADHPTDANHWAVLPESWDNIPESQLLSKETMSYLLQAIELLPPHQREVIVLRDIEGWRADEICSLLGISEANQRVLLHRARCKVRRVLEQYFKG